MDVRHIEELRRREAAYWWHVNKRRIALRLLEGPRPEANRLLEVGCGGGYLSGRLAGDGWRVLAADRLPAAVRAARAAGAPAGMLLDAGQGWPFAPERFDAVLMLDVLEHLADDACCLGELARVLRPGGRAVLTVPARPGLFSAHDEALGHRRRYTRRGLAALLRGAGLRIERLSGWNLPALPAAWILRRKRASPDEVDVLPRTPAPAAAALRIWGRLEAWWIARAPLPTGLSLATLVRKEAHA